MAYPPLSADTFAEPHRRGSDADLLVAGEFGWALVDTARRRWRGASDRRHPGASPPRCSACEATLSDLDDLNGDGFDDDGSFTLRAADGSAVCVTPGSRRTLSLAQGHQIDAEDGAAAHGLTWTSDGPCGTRPAPRELNRVKTGATPGVFGASREWRGVRCRPAGGLAAVQPAGGRGLGHRPGHPRREPLGLRGRSDAGRAAARHRRHQLRVAQRGDHPSSVGAAAGDVRAGGSPGAAGRPGACRAVRCGLRSRIPATPSFQGEPWPGFGRAHHRRDRRPRPGRLRVRAGGHRAPASRSCGRPALLGALASLAGPVYVVEG